MEEAKEMGFCMSLVQLLQPFLLSEGSSPISVGQQQCPGPHIFWGAFVRSSVAATVGRNSAGGPDAALPSL